MARKANTTCGVSMRVGRAIHGMSSCFGDILETDNSLLVLGPAACGKTTLMRDMCYRIAQESLLLVLDHNGEMGGDGPSKHSSLGLAWLVKATPEVSFLTTVQSAVQSLAPSAILVDGMDIPTAISVAIYCKTAGIRLIGSVNSCSSECLVRALASDAVRENSTFPVDVVVELPSFGTGTVRVILDMGDAVRCLAADQPIPVQRRSIGMDAGPGGPGEFPED
eukprot:TRINITY_DN7227_c1_g1_i1.p1 TRINITY_DN7227_c1_g1~~TRINITY_DN7227_c1_g1_i1.p1  ORF type:complete len:240 (-),score=22.43 TRINITY_DN7227_c1_g1_i1:89-754(-)